MSIFYFKNSAYRGDFSENASQFLILLRRRIRTVQLLPDSQIVGTQQEIQDALHRREAAVWPDARPHGAIRQTRLV